MYYFAKKGDFLQKNTDISKIRKVFVLTDIFSDTTYEISFERVLGRRVISPTSKRTPKKPTQSRVNKFKDMIKAYFY